MDKKKLPDIQQTKDKRGITISRVGIENIDFPLMVATKDGGKVLVYAKVDLYGSLRHQVKGTNMSRFIETLMEWKYETLDHHSMHALLLDLRNRLGEKDTHDVYVRIKFDYFLPKESPASKKKSVMSYPCVFTGLLRKHWYQFELQTTVMTTSNCPCSKEISEYGAHGQRSLATVKVQPKKEKYFWLEDLIPAIEKCGSCEIYPLLKRPDEKYVTEKAYKNPKFVEDIARDIAKVLQDIGVVKSYKIKVCNEESIHTHNAVAYVARHYLGGRWRNDSKNLRS